MRGVITQLIAYGWRYSIGNAYEELSYAESLDAAEVAAEYGYPTVAQSILDFSLQRMRARPWRFTAFRGGHILATAAAYYRLTHDRAFMRAHTAELASRSGAVCASSFHGTSRTVAPRSDPLASTVSFTKLITERAPYAP